MHRSFLFRWWLSLPALFALACGGSKHAASTANAASPGVKGFVTTEAGAPIAGVKIDLTDVGASAVSDANGAFEVVATGIKVGTSSSVTLAHPDYSPLHAALTFITLNTSVDYTLRAHGVVATVALPTNANDPLATVSAPGAAPGDGGATLRIAAGDLVLPSGAAATGNAVVKMTYWGPGARFDSAPAPLFGSAAADNNVVGLYSYGMANIEVTQGNDVLQVARGKTIALDFNRPAALSPNTLAGLDPNDPVGPHLWYADPNTGRWLAAGTVASGATSFNANDATVHAALPHLSAWNIDGVTSTNSCLTGRVINNCNTTTPAGAKYSLWILTTTGELAVYTIQTDATGFYAVNLNGAVVNEMGQQQLQAQFYAWISGYQQPDQTTCNPTGAKTYSELCTKDVQPARYPPNACAGWDTGLTAKSTQYSPIDAGAWAAKCNLPLQNQPMCGYVAGTKSSTKDGAGRCMFWSYVDGQNPTAGVPMTPGGDGSPKDSCGKLPDFVVPGCGSPPQNPDPCKAENAKHEGDACNQDVDCCPNASLECADGLCVPKTDAG